MHNLYRCRLLRAPYVSDGIICVLWGTSLNHPRNSMRCLTPIFYIRNMKFEEIKSLVWGEGAIQTQIYIYLNLKLSSQCLQCVRETWLAIMSLWVLMLLFSKDLLLKDLLHETKVGETYFSTFVNHVKYGSFHIPIMNHSFGHFVKRFSQEMPSAECNWDLKWLKETTVIPSRERNLEVRIPGTAASQNCLILRILPGFCCAIFSSWVSYTNCLMVLTARVLLLTSVRQAGRSKGEKTCPVKNFPKGPACWYPLLSVPNVAWKPPWLPLTGTWRSVS